MSDTSRDITRSPAAPNARGCRFWIAVASQDHVDAAVAGGYVEINHGKATPLERMRAGDGIAWYSPRTRHPDGTVLQAFTALGRITDAPMYQRPDLHQPFRRGAQWFPVVPVPIRPLLAELDFIRSKRSWGAAFRYGFVRVPREDFARIARALGCPFDELWPVTDAMAPTAGAPRLTRAAATEAVDA